MMQSYAVNSRDEDSVWRIAEGPYNTITLSGKRQMKLTVGECQEVKIGKENNPGFVQKMVDPEVAIAILEWYLGITTVCRMKTSDIVLSRHEKQAPEMLGSIRKQIEIRQNNFSTENNYSTE